ncbi:MAG TPA: hypothetical protein DCE07_04400 [Peptococcaceae bacterium]|nr:hypothetical protein [Peptococcaceae bacterium]
MAQNSGCLYVGDSPADIVAGKSAGTLTVAVLTGAGSRDALADFGPDLILESIRDLPAALFGAFKPLTFFKFKVY